MISSAEAIKIKKVIGTKYTKRLLEFLEAKNITSHLGTPYTRSTIASVMRGGHHNLELEVAIYDFVAYTKLLHKEVQKKKKQLLK